jgi:thiamine kinase-like enzyme
VDESPTALAQRIANELGLEGDIVSIGKLHQNNWNWQVGNKVILKIFIPNEEDHLEEIPRWEKESHALRLVGPQGFAPILLKETTTKDGIHALVRRFIPGKSLNALSLAPSQLIKIAKILQKIHSTHVQRRDPSAEGPMRWYMLRSEKTLHLFQTCWHQHPIPTKFTPHFTKKAFEQSMDFVQQLIRKITMDTLSLVHGDLLLPNILLSDHSDQFMLIDWEYSGYRDPAVDVSYFMTQNSELESHHEDFFQAYINCPSFSEDVNEFRLRVKAYDLILDWIYALWSANRALQMVSGKRSSFDIDNRIADQFWKDYETRITRITERNRAIEN